MSTIRKRVVAGMATMPSRATTLPAALRSIIGQVDRLYLYLDGHEEIPKSVRDNPRVIPIFASEEPGLGCDGKFLGMVRERESCLYIGVDDDIVYPPNYVSHLADELATYGSQAVVGVHGRRLKSPFASYLRDGVDFHFEKPLLGRQPVDTLGSGTIMFDTAAFQFDPRRWQHKNVTDIQVAIEASKIGLPMVCVSRSKGFLRALEEDQEDSLYVKLTKNDSTETMLAHELLQLRSLDRSRSENDTHRGCTVQGLSMRDVSVRKRPRNPHTGALILSYHRVNKSEIDTWALSVSPERFFEQMRALRALAEPCTLTDIAVGLLRGDLPHNAVAVTFDDGYLDNLLNAKPILEKFEIPATVFVCAGWVGQDNEMWWDQLERTLLLTRELPNRLELSVNGQHFEWNVLPQHNSGGSTQASNIQFAINDFPSRLKFCHDVWDSLRRMPPDSQIEAMQKIAAWSGVRTEARHGYRPMNAQELVDITAGGLIEIGAHTVSHPLLPAHWSGFQRHEIWNGKSQLEHILGIPISTFAYPYGEYDQATLDIVREAGFLCACTTVEKTCTNDTSIYELPRISIPNWDGEEFAGIVANRLRLQEQKSANFVRREFQARPSPNLQLAEATNAVGTDAPKAVSRPKVSFGDLSGSLPLCDHMGFSRGSPIDRFFIERFLSRHQGDICGHVLELGDNRYTKMFGEHRVSVSDVVDVRADNPQASIITDLQTATSIPSDSFDCIILTQVLIYMDDVEAALATVLRVLKPGGVALITVPGISQICSDPEEASKWNWSFYPRTFQRLLAKFFDPRKLIVEGFGNLRTTIGFLAGLAQEDIASDDYVLQDPRYPLIVAARATKPGRLPQIARNGRLSESPQVSVVMPVYNSAPFLAEAIESVLCQRFEEWELLIIDDGSTDASYEIAEKYASADPCRIRLFRHPDLANHGPGRTRNLGIAQARADIIAFLDSDDIWFSDKLSYDIDVLRKNPSAYAVFSNSLYWWHDQGEPAWVDRFSPPIDCVWPRRAFFRSVYFRDKSFAPCPSALTVRLEALRQLGGFDETIDGAEDFKLISELSFCFPVYITARCNSEYRRRRQSLWSSNMADGRDAAYRRRCWQRIWELVTREAQDEPQLFEELVAGLSRPAMTQLIGRRIIWGDERVCSRLRGPGDARGQRAAKFHLEAGRYILSALITEMAGSEHSIDVEVSSDDGCTRFAQSRIPVAEIQATGGRIGVFEVQPPSTNVALTIIPHGPEGALRGIDVIAEDWPFQTAEFVIHADAETH